ncbi:hypothetical protein [Clostridium sp. Marseille-P2415]|uniref:hypothetical protein n=1 Tax=Clostridium sp. Marseille-P2415 TaxID=1805471 RepID=UPI0009882E93|nr:hypothetical protein [Clostridium sp. Marseille-P2415]
MPNYRPVVRTIGAASAISATIVAADLTTTSWGLLLVRGSALFSNTVLRSGAVAVWESTNPTTASPDRQTFSDANGTYGITCRAGVQLRFKFYSS